MFDVKIKALKTAIFQCSKPGYQCNQVKSCTKCFIYLMVSLWYESLLTNTRLRFFLELNNCEALLILHEEKELSNDSERPLGFYNFTDKKAKGTATVFLFVLFFGLFVSFFFLLFVFSPTNIQSSRVSKWLYIWNKCKLVVDIPT